MLDTVLGLKNRAMVSSNVGSAILEQTEGYRENPRKQVNNIIVAYIILL